MMAVLRMLGQPVIESVNRGIIDDMRQATACAEVLGTQLLHGGWAEHCHFVQVAGIDREDTYRRLNPRKLGPVWLRGMCRRQDGNLFRPYSKAIEKFERDAERMPRRWIIVDHKNAFIPARSSFQQPSLEASGAVLWPQTEP